MSIFSSYLWGEEKQIMLLSFVDYMNFVKYEELALPVS